MSYKMPTKAIITDAGFASRFLPITKTIPKAMLPIGSKPVMQLVVEECIAAGITEIIIVATEEGKPIYEDYFTNPAEKIEKLLTSQGKSDRFQPIKDLLNFPKITVITQDPSLPYGNGSPIASAKSFINDDEAFIALYSDDLVLGEGAVSALIEEYKKRPDANAIIAVQTVEGKEIEKYAAPELSETGELIRLVEKPKLEEAPSLQASYGRYLLTPTIFKYLIPRNTGKDAELWAADAIDKVAKNDKKVYITEAKGTWVTTGDPKNYLAALVQNALSDPKFKEYLKEVSK